MEKIEVKDSLIPMNPPIEVFRVSEPGDLHYEIHITGIPWNFDFIIPLGKKLSIKDEYSMVCIVDKRTEHIETEVSISYWFMNGKLIHKWDPYKYEHPEECDLMKDGQLNEYVKKEE